MKLKTMLSISFLAIATVIIASGARAYAGPVTIDFNCSNGSGNLITAYGSPSSTAVCKSGAPRYVGPYPTGMPGDSLANWTQGAFDITTTGLNYNTNQGESSQGGAGLVGTPSLVSSAAGGSGTITVTDGGGWFDFDSIDMRTTGGTLSYTIDGYLNGNQEFVLTCGGMGNPACVTLLSNGHYVTVDGKTIAINDLVISWSDSSGYAYFDDADLSPVPEPMSFLLLGTGLLAMALVSRYRGARRIAQPLA